MIDFEDFKKEACVHGYNVEREGSMFFVRTKNGNVKCEIKNTKKYVIGYSIKVGWGMSLTNIDVLEDKLFQFGLSTEIIRSNSTKEALIFKFESFKQFFEVVNVVENIDDFVQRRLNKIPFDPSNIFYKMAKTIKFAIDEGLPMLLGRGADIYDAIDDQITIGKSVKWTPNNSYREHIVPCCMITDHAIDMFREGYDINAVAEMIRNNLFIVLITKEEAYHLDVVMKLQTTMPGFWKFGDSVFARLNIARIDFVGNYAYKIVGFKL